MRAGVPVRYNPQARAQPGIPAPGADACFTRPMKLAFCLFKYFPYSGLSRDFMRIVSESRRRGHDLHVFASE